MVFSNVAPDDETHSIVIRHRATDTDAAETTVIPVGATPADGAVSGDGCTVAYAMAVDPADEANTIAASTIAEQEAPVTTDDAPVTTDGVTVQLQAQQLQISPLTFELVAMDLCVTEAVDAPVTILDRVEAETPLAAPDLSVDGATIVFAITDEIRVYDATSTPEAPVVAAVSTGVADHIVGSDFDLSADGRTVVFESGPVDAAFPEGFDSSVVLATLDEEPFGAAVDPAVVLAPDIGGSRSPTISADAGLVVYASDNPDLIDGAPATGSFLVLADLTADPVEQRVLVVAGRRPDLAAGGGTVVYDAGGAVRVRRSESSGPFVTSTAEIVNVAVSSDDGSAVGASVSGPVLSGDGATVFFDHDAGVDVNTDALLAVDGHVWARSIEEVFAEAPVATTTTSTSTTTSTTSTTTVPNTTVNTTRTTTNTTRTTTTRTTRTTTRSTGTTASTTSTTLPRVPVFDPAAFEFAPTISNAGRRSAEISLINSSSTERSITGIAVEPLDSPDFTIDASDCPATLAQGARCRVVVTFAPASDGELTANVVATFADGSTVTSAQRGVGAPGPLLSVLPDVANDGQVVTVFGAGFPAGAPVELSWNEGLVTGTVLVDEQGRFTHTLVILPNTAAGPVDVTVDGQTDLFATVTTSILINDSAARNNPAVFGGGVSGR